MKLGCTEFAIDAIRLRQHHVGILEPPLLDSEVVRKRAQRQRLDVPVGDRTRTLEIVFPQCPRPFTLADTVAIPGKQVACEQGIPFVTQCAEEPDALLQQRLCRLVIVHVEGRPTEKEDGVGAFPTIAAGMMECHRLLGPNPRCRDVTGVDVQLCRSIEGFDASCRRPSVGEKHALQPAPAFRHVAPVPEPPHGCRQPQCKLRLPTGLELVKRSAKIVVLAVDKLEPGPGCAAQVWLRLLGQREEMLGVALSNIVSFAGLVETLECEFPDRLQHPIAVVVPDADEALVDERRKQVEVGVADRFDRLKRRAADEDGKPTEEVLLLRRQQLVAPPDHRA